MAYSIENVSRTPLHEDLDTKDAQGKRQTLSLGVRAKKTLTDAQWASRSVQKHIQAGRLRSKAV